MLTETDRAFRAGRATFSYANCSRLRTRTSKTGCEEDAIKRVVRALGEAGYFG